MQQQQWWQLDSNSRDNDNLIFCFSYCYCSPHSLKCHHCCHQIYIAVLRLIVVENYFIGGCGCCCPHTGIHAAGIILCCCLELGCHAFGASSYEIGNDYSKNCCLGAKTTQEEFPVGVMSPHAMARFQSKWQQSKAPEAMVRGRCCGSSSGGWYGQWWCCNGLLVGYTWNILLHSSQSQKISEKSSIFDNKNVEIT